MTCYSRPIWPSSLSLGILPASEDHLPDERLLQLVHPPQLLLQLCHERVVLGRDLSGASVSAVFVDVTDIHFALKIVLVAADDGDEFLIGRSSAMINGRKWENSARGQAIFLECVSQYSCRSPRDSSAVHGAILLLHLVLAARWRQQRHLRPQILDLHFEVVVLGHHSVLHAAGGTSDYIGPEIKTCYGLCEIG